MAVATHPQSSSIFPRSRSCTMSEIARRPLGFRMRNASANTAGLSGLRLITQLLRTTSAMLSARGIRSMGARTNDVFGARGESDAQQAFPLQHPAPVAARAYRSWIFVRIASMSEPMIIYYRIVVVNLKYLPYLWLRDVGSQSARERSAPRRPRAFRGTNPGDA